MEGSLNERMNEIKDTIQSLWERMRHVDGGEKDDEAMDFDSERNIEDDLPLTLERDPAPGIRYYATENSPFAIGAQKTLRAGGIDSFGEDDSPDPDQFLTPEH